MTNWIALIPAFIAIYYALMHKPEKLFLNVYIPTLLLLPQVFYAEIPGGPRLNAAQGVIIVVFFYLLITQLYRWRFSFTDLLMFFLVGGMIYSDYINSPKSQISGVYIVDVCGNILFPYIAAKKLIAPNNLSSAFAQKYVFLMFILVLISPYESRMTYNPFVQPFRMFFPGQEEIWYTGERFGFSRVSGPFAHPILFGGALAFGVILNFWLIKNKQWKRNFSLLPILLNKGTIIMIVLMIGMVLTFSRGPILACLIGSTIISIGYQRYRVRSFFIRLSILIVVAFIGYEAFQYYSSISSQNASGELEGTVVYRAELLKDFEKYVWMKPVWGYGSLKNINPAHPPVSIDNEYLFLTLVSGFYALSIFITIIVSMIIRLIFKGLLYPFKNQIDTSLSFTLVGIYITLSIFLFTVWMGFQIEPLFFIFTGWAEGYLVTDQEEREVVRYAA